jgi:hypothetical protein
MIEFGVFLVVAAALAVVVDGISPLVLMFVAGLAAVLIASRFGDHHDGKGG